MSPTANNDRYETAIREALDGFVGPRRAAAAERVLQAIRPLVDADVAAVRNGRPEHHVGVWSISDDGECCECPRCYVDDGCVCNECAYDGHGHDVGTLRVGVTK